MQVTAATDPDPRVEPIHHFLNPVKMPLLGRGETVLLQRPVNGVIRKSRTLMSPVFRLDAPAVPQGVDGYEGTLHVNWIILEIFNYLCH